MQEIWKDVLGYEGKYQVSNLGRVKRCADNSPGSRGRLKKKKEIILKPTLGANKYLSVSLGKFKKNTVHRLVAIHFCEQKPGKNHVDHINSERTDNRAANLRWVTQQENNSWQKRVVGSEHSNSKLTEKDVKHIRDEFDRMSNAKLYGAYTKIAKGYGINSVSVYDIVNRRTWKHV